MKPSRPRPRLVIPGHAAHQMRARNVTRTEVGLVVDEPEVTYESEGRTVYQRGALAVVLGPGWTVVTVLLRADLRVEQRWTDTDCRTRQLLPET